MLFLMKSGKDYAIFAFQTGAKNLLPTPSTFYRIQSQLSTVIVLSSCSCIRWGIVLKKSSEVSASTLATVTAKVWSRGSKYSFDVPHLGDSLLLAVLPDAGHNGRCLETPYYTHIYPPLSIIYKKRVFQT